MGAADATSPRPNDSAVATHPGRGTGWELVWSRLWRDRAALAAAGSLSFVLLACFIAEPILQWLLGHGPNDLFPYAVKPYSLKPVGPWTWVPELHSSGDAEHTPKTLFILGSDSSLGRDELLRLLAGGQVSLEIAAGAAAIALLVGAPLGALSGYFGGLLDAVVSRLTELTMAFPLLLLVIALGQTIAERLQSITVLGLLRPGVLSLAVVIGAFTWFYPARVVRAQTKLLRNREFVEAARVSGAGELRIVRTHLLPHLAPSLLIWATLAVPSNVILEAALSFLNFGVRLPTASWGNMLSQNWGTLLAFNQGIPGIERSHWTLFWPTAALFVTVLALALLGDGMRRAIDS